MSGDDMICEIALTEATTEEISGILAHSRVVAIVGLSPKKERASNEVGAYLIEQGYEVIPVNPTCDEILGKKSYAGLKDVPVKIDVVDIFRKPAVVPEIVDEAIGVGAGCVWMQEGIVSNAAAEKARKAGLEVVMDRCLLKEHKKWVRDK